MSSTLRRATLQDSEAISALIDKSARSLHAAHYTQVEIIAALEYVYGVDTTVILDGHYFVIEDPSRSETLIACGGWSNRRTLFGGNQYTARDDGLLSPERGDTAKIRAFFVHPDWTRRGLGKIVLDACENAARAAGYEKTELGSTLSGVQFYEKMGYEKVCDGRSIDVMVEGNIVIRLVKMKKDLL